MRNKIVKSLSVIGAMIALCGTYPTFAAQTVQHKKAPMPPNLAASSYAPQSRTQLMADLHLTPSQQKQVVTLQRGMAPKGMALAFNKNMDPVVKRKKMHELDTDFNKGFLLILTPPQRTKYAAGMKYLTAHGRR